MTTTRSVALIGLIGLLPACTPVVSGSTDDPGDTQAITAGQIVAGDSPYYWANLPFAEYEAANVAAGLPPTPADAFLPETDPLRARLQVWADRFETAMRKITGNTAAPHPVVQLLSTSKTYNAWSSPAWARLGAPVGDVKDPLLPVDQSFYFSGSPKGVDISLIQGGLSAYVKPTEWQRLQSFTDVWNRNPFTQPGCKLSSAGGRVRPTDPMACPFGASADDALVIATSPYLTVATDLVSITSDERAIAFVMAHELGHMFRAHTSPLTVRKYDFWFEAGPSAAKRPVPAASADKLAAQYRALVRTPIALDAVTGSALPRQLRLLPVLAAFYTERVRPTAPTLPTVGLGQCPGLDAWFATNGTANDLAYNAVNSQQPTPALQASYLALEQIVLSCPDAVHFTRDTTVADGLDAAWIEMVVASFNGNLLLPEAPNVDETLPAYLARATTTANTAIQAEADFRTLLNSNKIGLYTIEQEADEVALELMVRVGFTREEVLDAWVAFTAALDAKFPAQVGSDTGRADALTCQKWMKDGFMVAGPDGAMTPVVMTLGDINETHHGMCYRLYNLWREAHSHEYDSGPRPDELIPRWSELQQHAVDLTAAAAMAGR
jgi:hypothetical protein